MEEVNAKFMCMRIRVSLGIFLLGIFLVLTILPMLGVLVYGYIRNEASVLANLDRQVTHNMRQTVMASAEMVETVGHVVAVVADSAAMGPVYFKSKLGGQVLGAA